MVLKDWIEVLVKNMIEADQNLTYLLTDSVKVGAVALGVVGLSIFLKRSIWVYLFLLVLIASFFPILSFTNLHLTFSIGPVTFDLVAIPLLTFHIFLNIHLFRFPEMSVKEKEESNNGKIAFFLEKFESKSDDELLRMDESDLLPEAIEARKKLLAKREL